MITFSPAITPPVTVNLRCLLFVTFCLAIGAIVSRETQVNAIPGMIPGATFGLLFANLLIASDVLRYQPGTMQWAGAVNRLWRVRLFGNDARERWRPRELFLTLQSSGLLTPMPGLLSTWV